MLDRLDDTIVAVSSAPGYGPVGIVRLSGNDSIRIADRVSVLRAEKALADQPGSTHVSGEVLFDGALYPAQVRPKVGSQEQDAEGRAYHNARSNPCLQASLIS